MPASRPPLIRRAATRTLAGLTLAVRLAPVVATLAWGGCWYLPAWLVAQAWANLRRGWRDGSTDRRGGSAQE